MLKAKGVTEVDCPYCGRKAGQWCKDSRGIRRDKPHAARRKLFFSNAKKEGAK